MPLITTPGDPNANSYVTVAEADAFIACTGLDENWTCLSRLDREKFLIRSTFLLDKLTEWAGRDKTFPAGKLEWPRTFVRDPDTHCDFLDTQTIPERVKEATALYALEWANQSKDEVGIRSELDEICDLTGVRLLRMGPVELEFDAGGVQGVDLQKRVPRMTKLCLSGLGIVASKYARRVVRR